MKYFKYLGIGFWLLWASCAQAAEVKIGVVNLQQIMQSALQAKQAEVAVEVAAKQAALNQQAKDLTAQVKVLEQEYASSASTLAPQVKRDRLAAIAQKVTDNRVAITAAKAEIQSLQAIDIPIAQIQEIIAKYGKDNGYTVIFEMSAEMGMNGILYVDAAIDVTAEIQKLLEP